MYQTSVGNCKKTQSVVLFNDMHPDYVIIADKDPKRIQYSKHYWVAVDAPTVMIFGLWLVNALG